MAYQKERRERLRILVQEIKEEKGCSRCGDNRFRHLAFHHRNRTHKRFSIAEALRYRLSQKTVLEELRRCDILCHSCHATVHHERRRRAAA